VSEREDLPGSGGSRPAPSAARVQPGLDPVDLRIVRATQSGLPVCEQPYHRLAEQLELPVEEVMRRLEGMRARGAIRRIAAVPQHYALGFRANGMSVWDIDDARIDELGRRVGALDFVSHAYRRPRHLPDWRYNMFAMVHGRSRDEVVLQVESIAALLGSACRAHEILYSSRILKKTGLRVAG
jgi:siroheme decarboxylase